MQKTMRLGINNPCTENWDQMIPANQGRFCASCQKTVVDFTSMDDLQLLEWFAQHQGSACGLLRPDQLDRPLLSLPEKGKNTNRLWRYLIAALLFSSEASAQMKPNSPPMTQCAPSLSETFHLMGDTVINAPKRLPSDSVKGKVKEDVVVVGYTEVVTVHKKRKPIADTVSIFKDTLASIGLAKPALTAYPNPVARGASITLSARLDQPGKYNIQLLNSSGALIESQEVDRSANSGNITLPISADLVPGIYFVKLSHPALAKCYTQEIMVY